MKRIRLVEETIAERYAEWKMRCPTHLCTGQETVGAAVGQVLRPDDFALSTHRSHGHYLGKGGDLKRMLAEIYLKGTGCSGGKGGSMHLIDREAGFKGSTAIVGGTIPLAVGLGLSIALKGSDQISCVFFGDGAVEEGVFYESVSFAALKQLPVLFVCENNFYSVYTPVAKRQPAGRAIHALAAAMGVNARHGDGNDPLAVLDQVEAAVAEIRSGGGPRFLEFETYRWREHCGPNYDNHIGYRTEAEFLAWKERDPVLRLEAELLARGAVTGEQVAAMTDTINEEIAAAFLFAEQSPFPAPEELHAQVFKQ